jgi:cysteine dioxygenase
MKVLKGTLRETRFSYPDSSSGPKAIKETTYKENEVTYMADELGLHKISNPDQERLAVSLHRELTLHILLCSDGPIPAM